MLLAVLAAAGLLALAPALVRRYDATERLAAERAQSTARVLDRTRRRRTVPGPRPINAPRIVVAENVPDGADADAVGVPPATVSALQMATVEIWTVAVAGDVTVDGGTGGSTTAVGRAVWLPIGPSSHGLRRHAGVRPGEAGRGRGAGPSRQRERRRVARQRQRVPQAPAVYRRRRVLLSLVVLQRGRASRRLHGQSRVLDRFRRYVVDARWLPSPPAKRGVGGRSSSPGRPAARGRHRRRTGRDPAGAGAARGRSPRCAAPRRGRSRRCAAGGGAAHSAVRGLRPGSADPGARAVVRDRRLGRSRCRSVILKPRCGCQRSGPFGRFGRFAGRLGNLLL